MDRENERERDYWNSHDRRLSDHDNKISEAQRGVQAIEHELRQLIERINNGVSPTMQKVLGETSDIKLQIHDLDHKMEINLVKMQDQVKANIDHVQNYVDEEIQKLPERYLMRDDEFLHNLRTLSWTTAASLVLIILIAAGKYIFFDRQDPSLQTPQHESRSSRK